MTGMSKADRERMYTEYLRVEGYRPDLEQDGKVRFIRRDVPYFILVDDMEEHFSLGVPFYPLKTDEDRARARTASLAANDITKVARVCVYPKYAYAEVSTFFSPPDGFKRVFSRIMQALDRVMEEFEKGMEKS